MKIDPETLPEKNLYLAFRSEFSAWDNMKTRCYNCNTPFWRRYGGRGIRVCDKWLHSFRDFLIDMGPRPSTKHSLDRIDNDGNYTPENCRWATQKEQHRNTSSVHLVTLDGVTLTVMEWSERLGMSYGTLCHRLFKQKLTTIHDITSVRHYQKVRRRPGAKLISFNGFTGTLWQWSERTGLLAETIGQRLKAGWSPEKALTTPAGKYQKTGRYKKK